MSIQMNLHPIPDDCPFPRLRGRTIRLGHSASGITVEIVGLDARDLTRDEMHWIMDPILAGVRRVTEPMGIKTLDPIIVPVPPADPWEEETQ